MTAFENVNGTVAIPVINEAHYERQLEINLDGCELQFGTATAYLADNEHNSTLVEKYETTGEGFVASVKPRSMTTFFLE